jgi:hypothetical protein
MKTKIAPEFLEDLKNALSSSFVQRVLDHVINKNGDFIEDREDHRYHGIQDAWIRYASRGKSAYRVIYIRQKESVVLYRCGLHSVEDNVVAPKLVDRAIEIETFEIRQQQRAPYDSGALVSTGRPTLLRNFILQLTHLRHKEVVIISPYLNIEIFGKFHAFGRFLDRAIEEETVVSLITRPCGTHEQLRDFEDLEVRGINVFFHETIHAKVYLFDVDLASMSIQDESINRTALVGSANLTESGFGFKGEYCNEELCYRLPFFKYDEVREYASFLITKSDDFRRFQMRLTRSR